MSRPSILIVEDDAWLAALMIRALEAAGYRVMHAAHALDAIDRVDASLPSVIILDVLLTATTGFALLHELQSYSDTGTIPVILCTNLADTLQLDDVRPYGVRRILDKTIMQPDDLVAAVRSVLA